jgi:hypothetical protein
LCSNGITQQDYLVCAFLKTLQFYFQADGVKVYRCGLRITTTQQATAEAISKSQDGDAKFIYTILQIAFGSELLAVSSITGKSNVGEKTINLMLGKLNCIKGKTRIIMYYNNLIQF